MAELRSEFLAKIHAELQEPLALVGTPRGVRQIYNIVGGTFEGPRVKGVVLPGGADWMVLRPDGVAELDVRATVRTDDGEFVYTFYRGVLRASPEIMLRIAQGEAVDPSTYYFRTTPVFETGSEKYGWLNSVVAVGVGSAGANWVEYDVFAIL